MIAYNQAQEAVQNVGQQVAYAADQLQLHGFDRYYNAMVGTYVSGVYKTLPYITFAQVTNRARKPLNSIEQAVTYTTLYGKSHFDRFSNVIGQIMGRNTRTEAVTKTINIVDYGCGQGIASLALLSYLETYVNCENFTLNFHLIEPSQTTLDLAVLLVTKVSLRVAANITIHQYHKDLAGFLAVDSNALTPADYSLHLFSNVLDITQVQQLIPTLSTYLQSIEGKQMVIAVGPQYSNNYEGLQQLKLSLSNVTIKQDIADFSVESEIYSVTNNHWKHERSYGVMMGLCFKNISTASQTAFAA
ncbi:hypothetical protein [Psychrobacter immobilis]|uniref:hypothetical protein n=1 Tax=Psychrobacter immobilis TaxID=498 RepID=UPI001918F7CE|nr:hypothetical protein [Psychrobacter immobilis]